MGEFEQDSSNKIQAFTTSSKSIITAILENNVSKYIFFGVFLILIFNAIVVDILFFFPSKKDTSSNLVLQSVSAICPQSCIAKFSEFTVKQGQDIATSSSLVQVQKPTPTITPTLTSTPTPSPTNAPTSTPGLREYYIPLGQGNGSYTDWTVIPGMGAKISLSNYGKIEKVYFEATVRIPTGNQTVYVRLYNSSNQQNIVNSDLTLSSGTPTLLTSKEISLTDTKDENLYQVQLKTQLGSATYIDQARLRILAH